MSKTLDDLSREFTKLADQSNQERPIGAPCTKDDDLRQALVYLLDTLKEQGERIRKLESRPQGLFAGPE